MRYKFTLQERNGSWVYVLAFGKDTPSEIEQVTKYSDNSVSAEDVNGSGTLYIPRVARLCRFSCTTHSVFCRT
jgi:hypothetical protein